MSDAGTPGPRIALSGTSGFLGSHIATAARAMDVTVLPLGRADLAAADLQRRLEGVDCVIGAHGAVGRRSAEELHASNVGATRALATACRMAGTRYVHVSSGAVLGSRVIDDSTVLSPRTPYARSKAEAEHVVEEQQARGLIAVVARPTSVHGPGRPRTAQLVRFLARYPVPVSGSDGAFPFSWVGYVASALVELARRAVLLTRPVVVAEPRPPTAGEFLVAWHEASGRRARMVRVHPAVARTLASGLDMLGRLPLADRLPAGAVELLRYNGWTSQISELIPLPEQPPLATLLKACIGEARP
jgi:nucleoside-diphosphate-sugar epimerase